MLHGVCRFRTVVVNPKAQQELASIGDLPRIDDALAALAMAFGTHPEQYQVLAGGLRLETFIFSDGMPPIRVLFKATDDEIVVVAASVDPEQLPEL